MKMKLALVAAAAALSFSAHAQVGFYIGAEGGVATIKDQSGDIARSLVSEFGGSATVTQDTALGFGRLFGGYQFNKFVAAELGYLKTSEATATFVGTGSGGYAGDVALSISGFDLSAILKPFDKPGLNGLFFRAGVTSYEQKLTAYASTNAASARGTDTYSGTGTMFGIGYDLPVGPGAIRFQLNTLQKVGGESNSDTTSVSAGYRYAF